MRGWMSKYIVDTNVLIPYLAGDQGIKDVIRPILEEESIILSVIVISEFLVKADSVSSQYLLELADNTPVIEINLDIAIMASKIRKELIKKQKRKILLDCLIAASAIYSGYTLISRDSDYRQVSDLNLLVL